MCKRRACVAGVLRVTYIPAISLWWVVLAMWMRKGAEARCGAEGRQPRFVCRKLWDGVEIEAVATFLLLRQAYAPCDERVSA
jgi:hypothetical protein